MTEQPVETEQQYLGNAPRLGDPVVQSFIHEPLTEVQQEVLDKLVQPRLQHYVPNAHRFRAPAAAEVEAQENGPTNLELEAEVHAGHAVRSLENGELDAGIAWLQSALAFAQNARHSREFSITGAAL